MTHSILLVDDEEYILTSISRILDPVKYHITCCLDPDAALKKIHENNYQLVIADQRMPDMLGTELLEKVNNHHPKIRRILMSAHADYSDITAAFNSEDIHQFLSKPCDGKIIRQVVESQLGFYDESVAFSLNQEEETPKQDNSEKVHEFQQVFHHIATSDPSLIEQINFIKKVANFGSPFFIHGETGTGKELFARAIHQESPRKNEAFIAINCANLNENLLESQLFGHSKGAFTGADKDQQGLLAAADKGSLFLDEVTEIPLTLQAKLLRVLQEKEFTPLGQTRPINFDIQIISASAVHLEEGVKNGYFRDDLRYRLDIMPISLPPLRARIKDIKLLFCYLLRQQFDEISIMNYQISPEVFNSILAYDWPGNVREMVNTCSYIAALSQQDNCMIRNDSLPRKILECNPSSLISQNYHDDLVKPNSSNSYANTPQLNKESLLSALASFSDNKTETASYFKVSRMTLWRRLKKYGIQ